MQKGRQSNLPPSYFRRNNLSLVGCSPAEPTSVLIEQGKIQSKLLYLQSVKKSDHLQLKLQPQTVFLETKSF